MIYEINLPSDEGKKYQIFHYPAGEAHVRILPAELDHIAGATEIRVTAKIYDGDVIPLALLTDALRGVNAGHAREEVLILPYLPYSRADRRFALGDCLGLKVFGAAIDQLGYDLVLTLDAHSSASRSYIANLYCVSPVPLITDVMRRVGNPNGVVILPDEGAKRYRLNAAMLQCKKKRDSRSGMLSGFEVPPVEEFHGAKWALIVDDICDGGGTFLGISDAMKSHGIDLSLYVTHGIFSKGVTELKKRFKNIYASDSLRNAVESGVTILPAGSLFEDAIEQVRRVHKAS